MVTEITKAQLLCHQLGRLKDKGKAKFTQISMAKRNNVYHALEIARSARELGEVTLFPVRDAGAFDPGAFDLLLIGSPTRGFAPTPAIAEFTGGLPWAHLDIAGTAFNSGGPRGHLTSGGTGWAVATLVDYARALSAED